MRNTCSINNCERSAVSGNKCIFHCKKNDYSTDFRNSGFLDGFYDDLADHICNKIQQSLLVTIPNNTLKDFLKGKTNEQVSGSVYTKIEKSDVTLQNIWFPDRDQRDSFDYIKLLNKLDGISFVDCTFNASSLNLVNTKVFFDQCTFKRSWFLLDHKLLQNDRSVLYQNCTFEKNVYSNYENEGLSSFENVLFSDCIFSANLDIHNSKFKSPVFKNTEYKRLKIESLHISDSIFEDRFALNKYKVTSVKLSKVEFKDIFFFKNNIVSSIYLDKCEFQGATDFFESTFKIFESTKCNHYGFTGYGECKFGDENNVNEEEICTFKNVTFLDFVNFRNTTFFSGLDISDTNYSIPPNFLDISLNVNNTSRETFRIIKKSFDSNGNYVEGNNYYRHELYKLRSEARKNNSFSLKYLLSFYQLTSNYGQSYLRPLVSIIITSFIYWLIILGYNNNYLYEIAPSLNSLFSLFAEILNTGATLILPFSRILEEGLEFLSLIFYILFSIFIWLTILAVKRNTRR